MTFGQATIPERIAYARALRKRSTVLAADQGVISGVRFQPESAYGADGGRRPQSSGFRSNGAEGEGHRQQPHGDGDWARQWPQGVLRDAVGTPPGHSARRPARPTLYLFPAGARTKPIEATVLDAACRAVTAAAGPDRRVRLFWRAESGFRVIQVLLGHDGLSTTAGDTRVSTRRLSLSATPPDRGWGSAIGGRSGRHGEAY
jgi:integrase/recombinase XerD